MLFWDRIKCYLIPFRLDAKFWYFVILLADLLISPDDKLKTVQARDNKPKRLDLPTLQTLQTVLRRSPSVNFVYHLLNILYFFNKYYWLTYRIASRLASTRLSSTLLASPRLASLHLQGMTKYQMHPHSTSFSCCGRNWTSKLNRRSMQCPNC